jgi:hypothetical protein
MQVLLRTRYRSLRTYAFQQSKKITDPSRAIARCAGHIAKVRIARRGCGEDPQLYDKPYPTDRWLLVRGSEGAKAEEISRVKKSNRMFCAFRMSLR